MDYGPLTGYLEIHKELLKQSALIRIPRGIVDARHKRSTHDNIFDLNLFPYGTPYDHTFKEKEIWFYIVKIEGSLPWEIQKPKTRVYYADCASDWFNYIKGVRYTSCYKYGITQNNNPLDRDKKTYKYIVKASRVDSCLAKYVENWFRSLLSIKHPEIFKPLRMYGGYRTIGCWESVSYDYHGASELFHFDNRSSSLEKVFDEMISISYSIYNEHGEKGLESLYNEIKRLVKTLQRKVAEGLRPKVPDSLKSNFDNWIFPIVENASAGIETLEYRNLEYNNINTNRNTETFRAQTETTYEANKLSTTNQNLFSDIFDSINYEELVTDSYLNKIILDTVQLHENYHNEGLCNPKCSQEIGTAIKTLCNAGFEVRDKWAWDCVAKTFDEEFSKEILVFALTGFFEMGSSKDVKILIASNGGAISTIVHKDIDYLVCGNDPGSSLSKAKQLGIKIINEIELARILRIKKKI